MIKLTKGQTAVLVLAATPMAVVGVAGAVATYVNMDNVLHRGASALGMVAAGEGATLICALVALAVTLMGQHTPAPVRLGMWLVPLAASGVGVALAPSNGEAVVMGFTPLAMTAAGEGVAFVARRVVAYRTGVDIEQQRRSGLLLWHANRARNGRGPGRFLSKAAVWRLTRKFAETDGQLSIQLAEVQRYRIQQGADANLADILGGGEKATVLPSAAPKPAIGPAGPAASPEAAQQHLEGFESGYPALTAWAKRQREAAATEPSPWFSPKDRVAAESLAQSLDAAEAALDNEMAEVMAEAEQTVADDPTVRLLTTAEVAALKGVKPGTVRSWAHRGKFPRRQMVDGVPMYHPLDVAALD